MEKGNEGVPHQPKAEARENIESLNDWWTLRAEAPQKANEIIASIENFGVISPEEQMAALDVYIEALAAHNENRYIARELARFRAVIGEEARHQREMIRLGMAA